MLPVLWHHPFVCLGITHLDEKWLANSITKTSSAGASAAIFALRRGHQRLLRY
jgi:hypothetical protein